MTDEVSSADLREPKARCKGYNPQEAGHKDRHRVLVGAVQRPRDGEQNGCETEDGASFDGVL
jgi:hypothetical protein